MKIMKKYFILAVTAAMMSACSSSDDVSQSVNERIPLKIGTAYDLVEGPRATTRSTDQSLQSTKVSTDNTTREIGLFILKDNTTPTTAKASPTLDYEFWNIVSTSLADNTTDANKTNISVTQSLLYPSNKSQGINIFAYAPYSSTYTATDIDGSTDASNKLDVTVLADQSTNANYLKSDLLWGCVGEHAAGVQTGTPYTGTLLTEASATINATKYLTATSGTTTPGFVTSSGEVIVPMLHRGAKFVVKITTGGMPVSSLSQAQVRVYTPALASKLNLATGIVDALATAGASNVAVTLTDKLGYKPSDASTNPGDALAIADKGDNSGSTGVITGGSPEAITHYVCSGITMPMTLAGGDKLFEIGLNDGAGNYTVYEYKIPTTGTPITTFESGKVYTYTITVKASGLAVTSSVADWVSGGADQPGDAVLQ